MKISTKQITTTGLLLAICIGSQYFKEMPFATYFTGTIVNATIILATLSVGRVSGVLLSVIAPITAFLLSGSPIMAAIPLMFPVIMIGNIILVLFTYHFDQMLTFKHHIQLGLLLGSIVKAAFLGIVVVLILFPLLGDNIASELPKPEMLPKILGAAKITFSIGQLITASLGSMVALIVWKPLKSFLRGEAYL